MFALAYAGVGNDGIIKTFKINSSGSSVAQKNDKTHDTGKGLYNSLVHLSGTTYLLAYTSSSNNGVVKTFNISADGSTIAELGGKLTFDSQGTHNTLHRMSDNTAVLAYSNPNLMIRTFNISTDGATITSPQDKQVFTGTAEYNSIAQIDSNTYLVATKQGNNGILYSFDIPADASSITEIENKTHVDDGNAHNSLLATGSNLSLIHI